MIREIKEVKEEFIKLKEENGRSWSYGLERISRSNVRLQEKVVELEKEREDLRKEYEEEKNFQEEEFDSKIKRYQRDIEKERDYFEELKLEKDLYKSKIL